MHLYLPRLQSCQSLALSNLHRFNSYFDLTFLEYHLIPPLPPLELSHWIHFPHGLTFLPHNCLLRLRMQIARRQRAGIQMFMHWLYLKK